MHFFTGSIIVDTTTIHQLASPASNSQLAIPVRERGAVIEMTTIPSDLILIYLDRVKVSQVHKSDKNLLLTKFSTSDEP